MISLCMICANETPGGVATALHSAGSAPILVQCLESAKDAFDELCLMRAIGEQVPDGTVEEARGWCQQNGKGFQFGEYRNTVPGLKHVDDFAAARNKSFELATGGRGTGGNGENRAGTSGSQEHWLLWLDCDDYLTPEGCEAIREQAKACTANTEVVFGPYSVERNGGVIWRERLIKAEVFRSGRARWVGRVHEECVVSGRDGAEVKRVDSASMEVFHRGLLEKRRGSHERNLRLLELGLEEWIRGFFYYADALKNLGRREEGAAMAKQALAVLRPYQVEERYVMYLQLAELELDRAIEWLHEAVKCQPHRREAFAYLVQKSLNVGDKSGAVSYFRMLDGLPLPEPLPWTHQGVWYPSGSGTAPHSAGGGGWGRNYLYVRCLRACGNPKAEEFHRRYSEDPEYAAGVLQERTEGTEKRGILTTDFTDGKPTSVGATEGAVCT